MKDLWAAPKRGAVAVSEAHERRGRVALTVTWMAATLGIALFVPDIGKVIELIGGISAFFIFIFPGKSRHGEGGKCWGGHWCQGHCCRGKWPVLALFWGCGAVLVGGSVVRGAVLGLSFCADSRAVPRVRDWDPQPRATQKVSVCVLGGGGGKGRDRDRVWDPMGCGQGRSLGVTLVKVGTLQGGEFGCEVLYWGCAWKCPCVPGLCPGIKDLPEASLGAEELWGLVALGHAVGTGVG